MILSRRQWLQGVFAGAALAATCRTASAQSSNLSFERWVASFRPRALARGISGATYDRVMTGLKPDTQVFALQRAQPEFTEVLWQYLNRRVSDWRMTTGKERLNEFGPLLARIEQDYG